MISFAVTAKLISAFVFATRIVQTLFFLNLKFQASSHLLWLNRPVCAGPGQNPRKPVFSQRGSFTLHSPQAYQRWVANNGEEPKLPGLSYTGNQLYFINEAQVSIDQPPVGLTLWLLGNFACFSSSADDFSFSKLTFSKNISRISSECQIQLVRRGQSVCKVYQQTTLVGKELSAKPYTEFLAHPAGYMHGMQINDYINKAFMNRAIQTAE